MRLQGNRGEAYCSRRSPLAKADIDHPSAAERQLIGPLPSDTDGEPKVGIGRQAPVGRAQSVSYLEASP